MENQLFHNEHNSNHKPVKSEPSDPTVRKILEYIRRLILKSVFTRFEAQKPQFKYNLARVYTVTVPWVRTSLLQITPESIRSKWRCNCDS
jgi:hypothetical protein